MPLTPEQIAEIIYTILEGTAYAIISKNPAILPGMQALGASFIGLGNGSATPASAESAFQLILKELNIVVSPDQAIIIGLLDGANTQLNSVISKSAPALTTGLVQTILTTAGNAVNAACALYVTNNPPPNAPTVKSV